MMLKRLSYLIFILLAASCNREVLPAGDVPIGFNSDLSDSFQNVTKAGGTPLNQDFVVFGQNSKSSQTAVVFPWYRVQYVGGTDKYQYEGLTSPSGQTQGIKYWDYSAESYDFRAFAPADAATIVDDNHVSFAGINTSTSVWIARPSNNVVPHEDFGQTVTLKFIPVKTKIRVGFYETLPDFSIKDVKYVISGKYPSSADYTVALEDASISAASYSGGSTSKNGVTPDGTSIGTASDSSTMSDWIPVLPLKVSDAEPLSVSLAYTIVDNLSGRTIEDVEQSATVPLGYALWAINKAYTYIFKISEAGAEFDSFFTLDISQMDWDDRSDQNDVTDLE